MPLFLPVLGVWSTQDTNQSLGYFRTLRLYQFSPQLGGGGLWLQIFKFLLKITVITNVSPIAKAKHEWMATFSPTSRVFSPSLYPRALPSKGLSPLYGFLIGFPTQFEPKFCFLLSVTCFTKIQDLEHLRSVITTEKMLILALLTSMDSAFHYFYFSKNSLMSLPANLSMSLISFFAFFFKNPVL